MEVSNCVYSCAELRRGRWGTLAPAVERPAKRSKKQGPWWHCAQWGPVPRAVCRVGVARAVQGAPSPGPGTPPGRDSARALFMYLFKTFKNLSAGSV